MPITSIYLLYCNKISSSRIHVVSKYKYLSGYIVYLKLNFIYIGLKYANLPNPTFIAYKDIMYLPIEI